jgi:hypothetical protein
VSVTKGSAPSLSVSYSASTNRRSGDCADANGNIDPGCGGTYTGYTYDAANRGSRVAQWQCPVVAYSYAPGNKRVWRGDWAQCGSQTVDELTYYSVGGAKLTAYNLTVSGSNLYATTTGYYEYFGGKMLKNAGGWINQDRLGSIGKFYPYGQERPSATTNGKEKFATYFRDESSGDGRFLTPDPMGGSAKLGDPGSWNRYTYTGGDPVNRTDANGQDYACTGSFGVIDSCEYFEGIRGPGG